MSKKKRKVRLLGKVKEYSPERMVQAFKGLYERHDALKRMCAENKVSAEFEQQLETANELLSQLESGVEDDLGEYLYYFAQLVRWDAYLECLDNQIDDLCDMQQLKVDMGTTQSKRRENVSRTHCTSRQV